MNRTTPSANADGVSLSPQQTAHCIRCFFLCVRCDMCVGVESEASGVVAEHAGDSFDVNTVLQGKSCEGVTQIMEADGLQACTL